MMSQRRKESQMSESKQQVFKIVAIKGDDVNDLKYLKGVHWDAEGFRVNLHSYKNKRNLRIRISTPLYVKYCVENMLAGDFERYLPCMPGTLFEVKNSEIIQYLQGMHAKEIKSARHYFISSQEYEINVVCHMKPEVEWLPDFCSIE